MNRAMLRGPAWDVGLPVGAYYLLHLLGASDWAALLASTLLAIARIGWGLIRRRTLNPFATIMLLVFGLGLVLALVSGDPLFLLVKESFVTATVGLAFLVSVLHGRRPMTLAAQQSWYPDRAAEMARRYQVAPEVRRGHRTASMVWGIGLLTEAVLRLPLVHLLPAEVVVGLSTAMLVITMATLITWTNWYARRAGTAPAADQAPPTSCADGIPEAAADRWAPVSRQCRVPGPAAWPGAPPGAASAAGAPDATAGAPRPGR